MKQPSKQDLLNEYLIIEETEQEAEKWYREHSNEEAPPISAELSRRIETEIRRQRFKKTIHILGVKKVVAVVALAMICLSATAVAIGPKLHNFYYKQLEHSIVISDQVSTINKEEVENSGVVQPTYLPEGYHLQSIKTLKSISTLTYSNPIGESITFQIYPDESSPHISKEPEDTLTDIEVNGQKGVQIESEGSITIAWGTSPRYLLTGLSREILMKMAESVPVTDG